MDPRLRAALLWGVVAALSFLVLAQGYRLFAGAQATPGLPALLFVALLVAVVGAGVAYLVDGWLAAKRRV